MDLMTDAGQSPRDSCNLNGVGGLPRLTFDSGGGRGAAEAAPTRRRELSRPRPLLLKLVVPLGEFYGEGLQAPPQPAKSGAWLTAGQGQGHRDPEGKIPG